jgi:hypothetical protein
LLTRACACGGSAPGVPFSPRVAWPQEHSGPRRLKAALGHPPRLSPPPPRPRLTSPGHSAGLKSTSRPQSGGGQRRANAAQPAARSKQVLVVGQHASWSAQPLPGPKKSVEVGVQELGRAGGGGAGRKGEVRGTCWGTRRRHDRARCPAAAAAAAPARRPPRARRPRPRRLPPRAPADSRADGAQRRQRLVPRVQRDVAWHVARVARGDFLPMRCRGAQQQR